VVYLLTVAGARQWEVPQWSKAQRDGDGMSSVLSSFPSTDLTDGDFIQTWLVGNATADILIASAMLYFVRMQRSFSSGSPGADFGADNHSW